MHAWAGHLAQRSTLGKKLERPLRGRERQEAGQKESALAPGRVQPLRTQLWKRAASTSCSCGRMERRRGWPATLGGRVD